MKNDKPETGDAKPRKGDSGRGLIGFTSPVSGLSFFISLAFRVQRPHQPRVVRLQDGHELATLELGSYASNLRKAFSDSVVLVLSEAVLVTARLDRSIAITSTRTSTTRISNPLG
jgi:hypothetical protein